MPRHTTKRKAEGPVPYMPPSKARKIKALVARALRDTSEDEELHWGSDEGETVSVKRRERLHWDSDEGREVRVRKVLSDDDDDDEGEVLVKTREKRKRRVLDDEEEEEEGEAGSETQQLLEMVKFGSKEKREAAREASAYAEGFQEKLVERMVGIEKKLEGMNAEVSKTDAEFLKSIKTAYSFATPFALQCMDKELGGFAALYERSKNLTAAARTLVQTFEDVAQHIRDTSNTNLTKNNWKEEDKAVAALLDAGRRIGVDKYQSVMTASKQRCLSVEEARAERVLYDKEGLGESRWGKVAKKQEKAARKLAKASEVKRG